MSHDTLKKWGRFQTNKNSHVELEQTSSVNVLEVISKYIFFDIDIKVFTHLTESNR